MKPIKRLLNESEIVAIRGDPELTVEGLELNSQRIQKGWCFVAIKGFRRDGIEFVREAVANGANSVISIHPPPADLRDITWIQVKNDRRALSQMASLFYDNPSRRMKVIGVTGTNGKTTTVSLISSILNRETKTASIGTLGMDFADRHLKVLLTTPEAVELFRFMAESEQEGCRNLVMEVSSASLSLFRVEDIEFSQGVFTSFSGDHLDFHQTMENYFEAKLSLFRKLAVNRWAIINVDDPSGPAIVRELNCKYVSYGLLPTADVRPLKFDFSLSGIKAQLQTPRGKIDIESPLVGRFNLFNIMATVASSLVSGVSPANIVAGLKDFRLVRGRMEIVHSGGFHVIVDFAHTDDALANLLGTLRNLAGSGRIILVFGAGGDRDKSKRPRMGRVAAAGADYLFLTSDNPRGENPETILEEIRSGIPAGFDAFEMEADRERAIGKALQRARPGDFVVLAGKGHEEYQILKSGTIRFSDAEVVRKLLGGGNA